MMNKPKIDLNSKFDIKAFENNSLVNHKNSKLKYSGQDLASSGINDLVDSRKNSLVK